MIKQKSKRQPSIITLKGKDATNAKTSLMLSAIFSQI